MSQIAEAESPAVCCRPRRSRVRLGDVGSRHLGNPGV